MKKSKKKQTKFIASITENDTKNTIEDLAKTLHKDGITVDHVSAMLGYLSGKTNISLEELKTRYKSMGLNIESDREVSIK